MDLIEQLADAYLNGEEELRFFYNRETREVYVPLEEEADDWEDEENIELVPVKSSREMYEVMADFSRQFEGEIEEALFQALNGRKPFRAFKEAASVVGVIDQWYDYELAYAKTQMEQWLQQISMRTDALPFVWSCVL